MKFKRVTNQEILKEEFDQDMANRKQRRAESYRKYAMLEEGVEVDLNSLDDWALNAAGCDCRCSKEDIKEALSCDKEVLTEAPAAKMSGTVKQAADAVNAEEVVASTDSEGQIETALNRALKTAKRFAGQPGKTYPNVLFISEAGQGKTSICRAWARDNGINLVEVRASTLDPTDIGGLFAPPEKDSRRARKISTGEFDQLDKPNSVLFLDEFNRANKAVRGALLELVNSHYIPDSEAEGGQRFLPNFLFTIATANPPSGGYNVDDLDHAETSRFRSVPLVSDPRYILKYFERVFTAEAEKLRKAGDEEAAREYEGRLGIARKLLTDKRFSFDDAADLEAGKDKLDYNFHPLNYRSLTNLLELCDGTKDDFLELWNSEVNALKKSTADTILKDYKDVADKANEVLQDKSESEVFKKREGAWEKVLDFLNKNS